MSKKGLSIMLVFGSYGGFYITAKSHLRICLGWAALTIYPFDLENALENLMNKNKNP